MKLNIKIIFTLCVFFIFNFTSSFSQNARKIDYFQTLILNFPDLQDYMIDLDFEYNGSKADKLGIRYTWVYHRDKFKPSRAECFYALYKNTDGSKSISFQSQIKQDYVRFKSIIKNRGLIFRKTEDLDGHLIEYYSNSKFKSRIWVYMNDNTASYEMNLESVK